MGKKIFWEKWERNKSFLDEFKVELEAHIDNSSGWYKKAFPDSDVTFGEYLAALKELSRLEYSDSRKERLADAIKEEGYPDHISNLDAQYEKIKKQKEFLLG